MTTLSVKNFGALGDGAHDDTHAIQAAVEAAAAGDTVLVPAGKYMINGLVGADGFVSGGIFLKSNITFTIGPLAVLQVIPNTSSHYTAITVRGCENVTIQGPGAIVGDRDSRTTGGPGQGGGQFGFGIAVWGNSRNITIQNLTLSKLWGDGLTIIGASQVLVNLVTTDSCRRQNMSVIDGDGITIINSTFKNPQYSGLDLEANLATQTISNILVQYCNFIGAIEGPAHIGIGSPTGTYKHIEVKDCQFDLKMQPIFAHDNAGDTGTPWWAFLLNRIFYEGLHSPTYRFVGYPTTWKSKQ